MTVNDCAPKNTALSFQPFVIIKFRKHVTALDSFGHHVSAKGTPQILAVYFQTYSIFAEFTEIIGNPSIFLSLFLVILWYVSFRS